MATRKKTAKDAASTQPHPVEMVAAEGTNVLFDVWLVMKATVGVLDQALAPTGLDSDEFGVYSVISSSESMTPSELSRWMSAPPTTVSSYVKRMVARGHLVRDRHPTDGRSFVLRLTAEGRAAHRAAGAAFLPVLRRVVEALGPREPAVRRSLTALREALDAAERG